MTIHGLDFLRKLSGERRAGPEVHLWASQSSKFCQYNKIEFDKVSMANAVIQGSINTHPIHLLVITKLYIYSTAF